MLLSRGEIHLSNTAKNEAEVTLLFPLFQQQDKK
jgi:hypothetical protein